MDAGDPLRDADGAGTIDAREKFEQRAADAARQSETGKGRDGDGAPVPPRERAGLLARLGYAPRQDPILLYFLSTIEVRTRFFESTSELTPDQRGLLAEIKQRRKCLQEAGSGTIAENVAWTEAYLLERMMALLEPTDTLLTEIQLRLDEAAAERVPAEPRLRVTFTALQSAALDDSQKPPTLRCSHEAALRALLLEILEECHWTTQRKYHARPIQKAATKRVVWAGVISFILFILPYVCLYVASFFNAKWNWMTEDTLALLTGLPLYTALTAGLFGAYFSRLLFIQANAGQLSISELGSAREVTSILLRGSVGMCGGLVVFFFLRSGIVNGNMFPQFENLGLLDHEVAIRAGEALAGADGGAEPSLRLHLLLPSPSLALLAVWCFLAGFSERLVPSILSSTEETLGNASKGQKK